MVNMHIDWILSLVLSNDFVVILFIIEETPMTPFLFLFDAAVWHRIFQNRWKHSVNVKRGFIISCYL